MTFFKSVLALLLFCIAIVFAAISLPTLWVFTRIIRIGEKLVS